MLDLHAIKTMVCISYQNRYETRVTLHTIFLWYDTHTPMYVLHTSYNISYIPYLVTKKCNKVLLYIKLSILNCTLNF